MIQGAHNPLGHHTLACASAVAATFKNRKDKQAWAEDLLQSIIGHEDYLPAGAKRNAKMQQDPCATVIVKLAGKDAEAKARQAALKQAEAQAANRDLSKDDPKK